MESRIGATRFFSQDVRQGRKSILLPNLQRISLLLAAMEREWKKWEEHKAKIAIDAG